MGLQGFNILHCLLCLFLVLLLSCDLTFAQHPKNISTYGRKSFPPGFVFGASSSSYQYEGAPLEDGKGPSIWDNFTHRYPERIADGSNGDVANDFYHRYKADIKLMKSLGLDAFRFSISWSRVIPTGRIKDGVNRAGVDFYNKVINATLAHGMQPFVTIFHWDLPQGLEDEYAGFLSPRIWADFVDYSDLCFKEFGDRVKHWSTFNEPWSYCTSGYDSGVYAPARCSAFKNNSCTTGNSGTEPYIAAHNMLISHAKAVKHYRTTYKAEQKGQIGMVLNIGYFVPFSKRKEDVEAAERSIDFMNGWLLDPMMFGRYPESMRRLVGARLPKFSRRQAKLVKGSFDYVGANYYTSYYAQNQIHNVGPNLSYNTDSNVFQTAFRNGKPIGDPTGVPIFFVYPRGLFDVLIYMKKKYNNPPIYIMECGMGDSSLNTTTIEKGVNDTQRVGFYQGHLKAVRDAIHVGVKVKAFFPWSFLDTWEWASGFTRRFGLVYVAYDKGLTRHPKLSAMYYKKFLSS